MKDSAGVILGQSLRSRGLRYSGLVPVPLSNGDLLPVQLTLVSRPPSAGREHSVIIIQIIPPKCRGSNCGKPVLDDKSVLFNLHSVMQYGLYGIELFIQSNLFLCVRVIRDLSRTL